MSILSDGKVGIGTTAPVSTLQVNGGIKMGSVSATSDYNAHTIILSDGGTASEGGLLMTNSDTASAGNSSAKFNVTGSGGSGTTDLHIGVVDNNATNTFIRKWLHCDGPTGNVLFPETAQKVGIGTSAPTSKLHVTSDTSTATKGALALEDSGQNNHSTGAFEMTPFMSDAVPAGGYMDVELSNTGGWLFIYTQNGGFGMYYLYMNGVGTLASNQQLGAATNEITIAQQSATDDKIRVTNGDGSPVNFRGMWMGGIGMFNIVAIGS